MRRRPSPPNLRFLPKAYLPSSLLMIPFFGGSRGGGSLPSLIAPNTRSTSPSLGKRPVSDFEKSSFPFAITSNCPVDPGLMSVTSPNLSLSEAARLAARGLYPQAEQ